MNQNDCGCARLTRGESYEAGPTACIACPEVVASIREQIEAGGILSVADARLATLSGMLDIPSVGRSGFNDGMIYPPEEFTAPALAPLDGFAALRPTKALALAQPKGDVTLNCLVLLVDFDDNVGTANPERFRKLLFDQEDPNSMCRFYRDLSFGALTVVGEVTDWIRADHPYDYYTNGQSGTGGAYPRNTPGLLQEILTKYCASRSLAPFDLNQDGFVDGLFLVHAGPGAETVRDPIQRRSMIWSHKWTLPTPYVNDGVKAYAYFTAPEDGRLGVFSHEFGHFLGLPDLYDTSYRSYGVGDWCLMGAGSWNGGGDQPARMSAWCLATLGWIVPRNVTSATTLTIGPLEQDKDACWRLWTGGRLSREYFLIENRQQSGRDAQLPGSGLALWHVDETQSDNTNPLAYKVALVQADGTRDLEFLRNEGDAGDLFPGSRNVTQVNDANAAHPHTRRNDGTLTGVALSNIRSADGVITVDVTV